MLERPDRRRSMLGAVAAILMATTAVCALVAFDTRNAQTQPRALDVPYVPTPEHIVEAMLRLANPGPDDFLVDLGCGDGRIPITAAQKYGTRGFGVDLNPQRIREARANANRAGVTGIVDFIEGDLFKTDFKKASVLTLYLLPMVNMRLRPAILDMKPGTRVVSHAFHMEDWEPDKKEEHGFRTIYHWIVPAKAAGNWTGNHGKSKLELKLAQKFQMVTGIATLDGQQSPIGNGRISGEEIAFDISMPDGGISRIKGRIGRGAIAGWPGVPARDPIASSNRRLRRSSCASLRSIPPAEN